MHVSSSVAHAPSAVPPRVLTPPLRPLLRDDAAARAFAHLSTLQGPDGVYEAETVWNTMVLAQSVILRHLVTQMRVARGLDPGPAAQYHGAERERVIRYFDRWQVPVGWGVLDGNPGDPDHDGAGWGMHI